MQFFALVVVGLISGMGIDAQVGDVFKDEKECRVAAKAFVTDIVAKGGLNPKVEAYGLDCVKVVVSPGKPV